MPTYTPIQSIQLTSSASSVTFSGIPQIYQDLILVCSVLNTTADTLYVQYNGDTGTNYSCTYIEGNGTSAISLRQSNVVKGLLGITQVGLSSTNPATFTTSIMNYSNSTTYKTALSRAGLATAEVESNVHLWRNTSAINSIKILPTGGNLVAGSTFDLYGLSPVAAQNASAAGGTDIFYDSTYVYHVFKGSGTFTPYRNLTADYLVVAGGGGGGGQYSPGGGGAGGLRVTTGVSLTSGTSYAVTVGAGGPGTNTNATPGASGTSSSFSSYATSGGGGGSSSNTTGAAGGSGGGGSGDGSNVNAGAGNSGSYSPVEGYAGGASGNANSGGGGGGAGAVGSASTASVGGNGGAGASTYNSIDFSSWLTTTGTGSGGKLAGGGGGGARSGLTGGTGSNGGGNGGTTSAGSSAATNTGSGGGGGSTPTYSGANGGSGLVIVRYAR